MTTDYRALCAELVNELRLYKVPHPNHDTSLIDRAFALLNPHTESAATNLAARPLLEKVARMADCIDQRTVSEIIAISNQAQAWLNGNLPGQPVAIEPRGCPTPGACSCVEPEAQPEPVAPTDEKAWQWYSYCPEDGIELHSSKELAYKAAQEIMGSYAKTAHSDGWHEDMESVSWGMLLPVEQAQVVERTEAEPDSEFDEWIRYELVPARWGTPAIQPVTQQEAV
jgi:hypothetical protein